MKNAQPKQEKPKKEVSVETIITRRLAGYKSNQQKLIKRQMTPNIRKAMQEGLPKFIANKRAKIVAELEQSLNDSLDELSKSRAALEAKLAALNGYKQKNSIVTTTQE